MHCGACQALQEQWDLAAANLARANEEDQHDQSRFRSLAAYPWSYPVYEPTGRQKSRNNNNGFPSRLGTRQAIFTQVLKQSDKDVRIAMRDTCKQFQRIYDQVAYQELDPKKLVFNARYPREILVLDWRCKRLHDKLPPSLPHSSASRYQPPAPTFEAAPVLRPARYYEREKRVINSVYFETIVFEEFKRPPYVDELDWTSRTTFHSGVETPSGHVLLETSLTSEPYYLAPGHESASVMCERWTRLANRDWIEYLDSDAALMDAGALAAGMCATKSSGSPDSRSSELYDDEDYESVGDDEDGYEDEEDEDGEEDDDDEEEEEEEEELTGSDSPRSSSYAADSALASDDTSISGASPKNGKGAVNGTVPAKSSNGANNAAASSGQTFQGGAGDGSEPPPVPPFKGKSREGQKRRWQLGRAPVDLLAGFSAEALAQIVVGRYREHPDEPFPERMGPTDIRADFDRRWARGTTSVSKAWQPDGPLYLFLVERSSGFMPVNAVDPIIFNNMTSLMHRFTLDHMEAVAAYLNLPPLPPPAKKGRQSASIQDFLWRTFLGTNEEETSSLPASIKDAIRGMMLESWRRTISSEPMALGWPRCLDCAPLVPTTPDRAELAASLIVFRRECAKLRRATAPLRLYSSKAPTCTCSTCKKAMAKTQAAVNKWSGGAVGLGDP